MLSPMNASAVIRSRAVYQDCPCCGYRASLSVTVKNGRQLFHCHAGCSQDDLLAVMRGGMPRPVQQIATGLQKDTASIRHYARQLWDSAYAMGGTLGEVYLRTRGLTPPHPASLRFLPGHMHKPSGQNFPVMLAAVIDCSDQMRAVHRTYLARDGKGKAAVEPAKMTLGPVSGFACHLAPAGVTLAVSEGIETGLSVMQATGIPTWAALSAGGIRNLILPPLPLAAGIIIAADADPVGMKSASDAALRWRAEGRRIRIALPPEGQDFNDILQRGATP